jgi:hypothetical protein
MAGLCPKCEAVLSEVRLDHVDVKGSKAWHGVSYSCPYCLHILTVGIDPVALKTDTVKAILQALGQG